MTEPKQQESPDQPTSGIIELIAGCMFSGKTTAMLHLLREETADTILVVKHAKDKRYSRCQIVTHDGDGCEAAIAISSQDILDQVADRTQVVAIDEGHFYDDDFPEVCKKLADAGKRVIVTSLDLDMWGQPFQTIEKVKGYAGVVRIQRAVCAACGLPATRTHRKTPIVNRNLVGGSADFEPRCESCWSPPPETHIDSNEMA